MNSVRKLFVLYTVVSAVCVIAVSLLLSTASAQDATATPAPLPHWTYEGEEGPAHWGALDPRYAACGSGRAQSPIDIKGPLPVNLTDIGFNYTPSALAIFNNGHTIQVNYDQGSSITYNEDVYQLVQFHFHHPSEHTLNGVPFAMELHLVHRDAAGNLAVVGVMLRQGSATNDAYAAVFDHLPTTVSTAPGASDLKINAADLLPKDRLYTTYLGSLTTPPCTEGVRWLVLQTPVDLSAAQIEAFGKLFESDARPVQPLNNRDLLSDTTAGA